ncbi:MAG: alpha/beta hydrolase-fold protein [Bacteroidota bacterium]
MKYRVSCAIVISITCLVAACNKEVEEPKDDEENITIPAGTVDRSIIMTSSVLTREMHLSVYLPPGYDTSKARYPVLYLLHGMWGNYIDWSNNGMAFILDNAIYSGKAKPMIVMMPDGLDAFYCNNYNNGTLKYEDYMTDELFPYVDSHYRTRAESKNRAIAGLSMGGYGSTFHAFKRPHLFGSCYSMSGALAMGSSAPDLQALINSKDAEELLALPAYTMECGTEDALVFNSNVQFDSFLTGKNISHTFIKRPGSHDWTFWMTCLPKAVEFVSKNFE